MWKWKSKPREAGEDPAPASGSTPASGPATLSTSALAPPPAYGATSNASPPDPQALSAALGALDLDPTPPGTDPRDDPNEDTCLAHLCLLAAFNRLKNETGYRDGLWDIWDRRAQASNASPAAGGSSSNGKAAGAGRGDASLNTEVLVKLREKRWAVYVGRAADRYAAWWRSFVPDMLLERDMVEPSEERRDRYEGFPSEEPMAWNADMLPPLGRTPFAHR
ncbi:uncharacterized protein ColSpa_03639 [Colletotrichum spaethianum]|uniref:Uncharacterized protein n=1 Tax=Colletotrichum spaethianum TaxID=700344 RepID=A0AA37LBX1_9PEZI|nr:uncharacterized protein ColSpa_03639 [Colletotrichum spaethianum]GKT43458.1 hypothetical protein ColSpa_03639 [Colletotrichum spaethianum]